MIQQIFVQLNAAMSASVGLALLAAFAWGVLSILLSPCHLASIPLVVGFVNGQGKVTLSRAFSLASLFSLGILVTIALLGVITAAAGRIAAGSASGWVQRYLDWNQQNGAVAWLRRICGVLVILGGLWLIYTAP